MEIGIYYIYVAYSYLQLENNESVDIAWDHNLFLIRQNPSDNVIHDWLRGKQWDDPKIQAKNKKINYYRISLSTTTEERYLAALI